MSDEQKNIINIGRKDLSKEEIGRKQNLGKILHHHQKITKRPIYQQRRFYFAIFLVLVIVYLIYLSDKEVVNEQENKIEEIK